MNGGRLWTQQDRYGNVVYLTAERWEHIVHPENHPEVEPYFEEVRETIKRGRRKQDSLRPNAYTYRLPFSDLPDDKTHIVVAVLFPRTEGAGNGRREGFVVTAYFGGRE